MSDLKEIPGAGAGDEHALSDEQMLAYFEGRLSPSETRAVEETLSNAGAESDALEGLQALGAADARRMKRSLDASLQQMLHKKGRWARRDIAQQRWTILAIGIILLLAILCYALMWMAKHPLRR